VPSLIVIHVFSRVQYQQPGCTDAHAGASEAFSIASQIQQRTPKSLARLTSLLNERQRARCMSN
jgi:hypothetical protein